MVIGLFLAFLSGVLISLQNTLNSKVNERTGSWVTTTLVLGMGFLASFTLGFILEGKELFVLHHMKTWYWFSGLLGVVIVTCLMQGYRLLGATYAISIALTSQLVFALLFDSLGLFGLEVVPFTFRKLLGVLVIISGILVFKLGGGRQNQEMPKNI